MFRLFVSSRLEETYERVMRRLLAAAASLRVGNPEQPGITVGPCDRRDEHITNSGNHREGQDRSDAGFSKPPTFQTKVISFRRQFSRRETGDDAQPV